MSVSAESLAELYTKATVAPSAASLATHARPMPRLPPVTIAVLPSSRMISIQSSGVCRNQRRAWLIQQRPKVAHLLSEKLVRAGFQGVLVGHIVPFQHQPTAHGSMS